MNRCSLPRRSHAEKLVPPRAVASGTKVLPDSSMPETDSHSVARQLAEDVLERSGKLTLRATGRSMVPAIWPGDRLVVEPAGVDNLTLGDILLFSNSYRFVAHRVVGKNTECGGVCVLTRGDAMPAADAPVRPSEILGKVSFVVRDGKLFTVRKRLSGSERALTVLLRRSDTAARVVLRVRIFILSHFTTI